MAEREYKVRVMQEGETLDASTRPHIEDHAKSFSVRATNPDAARRLAEKRLRDLRIDVRNVRHSPGDVLVAMVRRVPLKG